MSDKARNAYANENSRTEASGKMSSQEESYGGPDVHCRVFRKFEGLDVQDASGESILPVRYCLVRISLWPGGVTLRS